MEVREPGARYLVAATHQQTEVGEIPADWQLHRLVEVAEIRSGIAKNANAALSDPVEVPYLRVANVQDGYLDLTEVSSIRVNRADLKRFAVLPNDVLMNEGGDLDKLGRGSLWLGQVNPCVHQNHVFVVRCKAELSPRFLNAWTSSPAARRYFLLAGRQTTNLASINKSSLGQLPVPVPRTSGEQDAIAEALSDTDALIESLEQLLAKKRQIKQGAMQELLTGQRRLPGFVDPWCRHRLGGLVEFHKGKGLPKSSLTPDGSTACIHYGELFVALPVVVSEPRSKADPFEGCVVSNAHDVLMPTSDVTPRGLAKASCVLTPGVILGGDILVMRPNPNRLWGPFLSYLIRYDEPQVLKLVSGSTVFHLYAADMRRFECSAPSVPEQTAIATTLSDMDAEISTLGARLAKTRQLKQGMAQALLTGRIRLV